MKTTSSTLLASALCLLSLSSQAAVLLTSAGQLVGATGVDVNGSYYDVSFVEGTCANHYSGCNNSWDFNFTSQTASLAAQALLDQVFLGTFDDSPALTFGCSVAPCNARIAYGTTLFGNPHVFYAINNAVNQSPDAVSSATLSPLWDSATLDSDVWAIFTPGAAPVPLPAAAWLFGSALLGLATQCRLRSICCSA